VSTRAVDGLVKAMGSDTGISKSEFSRICAQLDAEVAAFRERTVHHTEFPYIFLDATYLKSRIGAHVVSQAMIVAIGVWDRRHPRSPGTDVGDSESFEFWNDFRSSLRERGLHGVRLAISDAHAGLNAAVARQFTGAGWQRCHVHFMRNLAGKVPGKQQAAVLAAVTTIFAHTDRDALPAQWDTVADTLEPSYPAVAAMMSEAKTDVPAFAEYPLAHWQKIWSNNPIERLNKETKRRADVVETFPNNQAILRLATSVVIDQHDEWQVCRRPLCVSPKRMPGWPIPARTGRTNSPRR
jgi:putative transposase